MRQADFLNKVTELGCKVLFTSSCLYIKKEDRKLFRVSRRSVRKPVEYMLKDSNWPDSMSGAQISALTNAVYEYCQTPFRDRDTEERG